MILTPFIAIRGFEDISIGERASVSRTIQETDLCSFSDISGDLNPLHVSDIYASKSLFKGKIAHGLFVASFISHVLGMKLPGPGTVYLSQSLYFFCPVYIGDTIETTVEVLEKIRTKYHILLRTWCTKQDGQVVLDGEAKVLFNPDKKY